MGVYLDNFVSQIYKEYYIENNDKRGWLLFDIVQTGEITQHIWSKKESTCLGWRSEEAVEQFLIEYSINPNKVNIKKYKD